jgi:uncharacterized protein (DUF58 family)
LWYLPFLLLLLKPVHVKLGLLLLLLLLLLLHHTYVLLTLLVLTLPRKPPVQSVADHRAVRARARI